VRARRKEADASILAKGEKSGGVSLSKALDEGEERGVGSVPRSLGKKKKEEESILRNENQILARLECTTAIGSEAGSSGEHDAQVVEIATTEERREPVCSCARERKASGRPLAPARPREKSQNWPGQGGGKKRGSLCIISGEERY